MINWIEKEGIRLYLANTGAFFQQYHFVEESQHMMFSAQYQ